MHVEVAGLRPLHFDDGSIVRAASAVAPFASGWLVAQDDSTHAAWVRERSVVPVRVFPPIEGHEVFAESFGTKHLKPDVEAACELGGGTVLLLGSASSDARMRASLVRLADTGPAFVVADLAPLYRRVAETLEIPLADLNMEGACRVGDAVRWFARGHVRAGVPSSSVDVELAALADAVSGRRPARDVVLAAPRRYDLGEVEGVALAVTDAVTLPDGRVLVSAAAEDSPDAVSDGPVVATALALLDGDEVVDVQPLPEPDGRPHKVEGLGLRETTARGVRLIAVVDDDDENAPSVELDLHVTW